jgi:hypothetical protein
MILCEIISVNHTARSSRAKNASPARTEASRGDNFKVTSRDPSAVARDDGKWMPILRPRARSFLQERIESLFVACGDRRGPRVDLGHLLRPVLVQIYRKAR